MAEYHDIKCNRIAVMKVSPPFLPEDEVKSHRIQYSGTLHLYTSDCFIWCVLL